MLQIREKGLTIAIDQNTGNCFLRYSHPIKPQFAEALNALNISSLSVKSYRDKLGRNVTKAIFITSGDSTHCINAFRAVQKTIMLHSRMHKITELQQQISSLQQ